MKLQIAIKRTTIDSASQLLPNYLLLNDTTIIDLISIYGSEFDVNEMKSELIGRKLFRILNSKHTYSISGLKGKYIIGDIKSNLFKNMVPYIQEAIDNMKSNGYKYQALKSIEDML